MVKQAQRRGQARGPQGWAVCTGARRAEPGAVTPLAPCPQALGQLRATSCTVLSLGVFLTLLAAPGAPGLWGRLRRQGGVGEGGRHLFLLYPAWFWPLLSCPRPGPSVNPQGGTSHSLIVAVEQTGRERIWLHHSLTWTRGCHSPLFCAVGTLIVPVPVLRIKFMNTRDVLRTEEGLRVCSCDDCPTDPPPTFTQGKIVQNAKSKRFYQRTNFATVGGRVSVHLCACSFVVSKGQESQSPRGREAPGRH